MNGDELGVSVGQQIGRWRIEGTLGRGGAATVYAARHDDTGQGCALKILRDPDEEFTRRLLREGRVQAGLRHPNVAAVLEVLEWEGRPVLALERVDGPDLAWLLARCMLTVDQARRLGTGILLGVRAAHRAGLIHRDLKPGNVLLDPAGGTLLPRVADFGLVKVVAGGTGQSAATRSGQSFGTPGYMAPEQFVDAGRVDARVDIFALGAVLYEMLGGRPAFRGRTVFEVHARIQQADHPPLGALRTEIPAPLAQLLARCLAPDRDARPKDVDEVLATWDPSADPSGRLEAADAEALIAEYRGVPTEPAAAVERTPSGHTLAGILTRMRQSPPGDDPELQRQLGIAFAKNDSALRGHCRRELRGFSPERIEEVLQDVKLEAWNWLVTGRYRPDEHFRAFLFVVAGNQCRNVRRKRRDVLSHDGVFDPGSEERGALTRLANAERDGLVDQALECLDPGDREVVRLRYMLDYPYEDVAEQVGLGSANEVRVALQRSRRKLERELRRLLAVRRDTI